MGVLNEYMAKNKEAMKNFIKQIATVPDISASNAKKKESLLDKLSKKSHKPTSGTARSGIDLSDKGVNIRFELASMYRHFARSLVHFSLILLPFFQTNWNPFSFLYSLFSDELNWMKFTSRQIRNVSTRFPFPSFVLQAKNSE
jgi:hypothetical protein